MQWNKSPLKVGQKCDECTWKCHTRYKLVHRSTALDQSDEAAPLVAHETKPTITTKGNPHEPDDRGIATLEAFPRLASDVSLRQTLKVRTVQRRVEWGGGITYQLRNRSRRYRSAHQERAIQARSVRRGQQVASMRRRTALHVCVVRRTETAKKASVWPGSEALWKSTAGRGGLNRPWCGTK